MSQAARDALIAIGTRRQGATPPPATRPEVLEELRDLGHLGKTNGLTRKGSIKRELIMDELLDAAF